MEKFYCGKDENGADDPYGEEPTVFKIAVFMNLKEFKFGFMLVMRNIYLVRLILMFFPGISDGFKKFLIDFR